MIDLSTKSYKRAAFIVILLRIISPLFVWVNLFLMPLLFRVLDAFDYGFIFNSKIMGKRSYQNVDKILDLYYLAVLFIVSIYWRNPILIVLFLYRLIGFLIFFLIRKRIVFVFFMNSFELMFNIYAFGYVYNEDFLNLINENIVLVLILVHMIVLIPELYLHYFEGDSLFFRTKILKKKV